MKLGDSVPIVRCGLYIHTPYRRPNKARKPFCLLFAHLLLIFILGIDPRLATAQAAAPVVQPPAFITNPGATAPSTLPEAAWRKVRRQLNDSPPLFEYKKILASDRATNDSFGRAVALAGDLLAVGAHWKAVGTTPGQGAVYLFARNAGGADNWGQVKKLTASDGAANEYFGQAVALSGDVLVVGALQATVNGHAKQGAAYIFMRNAGGADHWGQVKKLTASDGATEDFFGLAAAVSNDLVVVGAHWHQVNGNNFQGAAYLFQRNAGGADNWGEIKHLTASDGAHDTFGQAVSISGDTIAIGAPKHKVFSVLEQGAVYLFQRNQGGADQWGQYKELTPGDGYIQDHFGSAVALNGDLLVVGMPDDDVNLNEDQGSAYLFARHAGGANQWGEVQKLFASDAAPKAAFGSTVAVSGDTVVIGAPYHAVNGRSYQGAAYTFQRNQGGADHWGQVNQLRASDGAGQSYFGLAAALSGETLVIGAPFADDGAMLDQGAAYLFQRVPMQQRNWVQKSPLLANDGAARDWFGAAVALDGDTLAVGAQGDDNAANGNQGAVYLFQRNAGGTDNWGLVQKLVAVDGATEDSFGAAVALAGDLLVVGAETDDVDAGIDQGSAYLFQRAAGGLDTWGLIKHLTASDGAASDNFGTAVALDGDTVAIGAPGKSVGDAFAQGAAYLFQRNQGGADTWGEVKKLVASDGAAGDQFAIALSLSQDTLVVGAYGADSNGNGEQGAAYLFGRQQGGMDGWGERQKVTAHNGAANDWFGWSVAIDANTLVVGALFADVGANNEQGAAYLFQRNHEGEQWGEVAQLVAGDGQVGDQLGNAVAVAADQVVVGAPRASMGANGEQGAAYLFSRNQGGADHWQPRKKLLASDGAAADQFGAAVAIAEGALVVGSYFKDGQSTIDQGAVYLYTAAANTAPTAQDDMYATAEDTPLALPAPGLLANDQDPNADPLTATLLLTPTHGELRFSTDGAFVYTPTLNFAGADTFTYQATDGITASQRALVTITVTAVNDAPLANAGIDQTVFLSAPVTLNGAASRDPDAHLPLQYGWVQTAGPAVLLSSTVMSVTTFTAPSTPAVLTFTLTVTDALGLPSVPSPVTVTAVEARWFFLPLVHK